MISIKELSKQFLISIFALTLFILPAEALTIDTGSEYIDTVQNKKISMDFVNADLVSVLKIFSQQSGLNFITDNTIANRTVNLYLDQVPVEEALERILTANGLTYELRPGSNIFIVKELVEPSIQLMTRVYRLKYATVGSSKINSTLEESDGTSTATSEATTGIVSAIRGILTENGSLVEDPRTNSLIVTDLPTRFPMIEQTLAGLDIRIPQILIEVEMLDISKTTADQLGVKWGSTPMAFTGAEKDGIDPFNFDNMADDNLADHTPGSRDALFEDPRYRVSTLSFSGLSFALQFLKSKTDTQNLARPRILTLNNETATIEIKTSEAIGVSQSTVSSEGTASSAVEAERVQTGVFLKVTPQADLSTNEITMAIEPKVVQARTGATFTTNAGTQTFKDPEERGSKSVLRIKNGNTVIIGGLLRNDTSKTNTRVPVLSKLPIIKKMFNHDDNSGSQRELIIFITPKIIDETIQLPPDLINQKKVFINDSPELLSRQQLLAIDEALFNASSEKSTKIDNALNQFEKSR